MPNWCLSSYTIEGDKKEIDTLFSIMSELESLPQAAAKSDYGKRWLGCLVNRLGGDTDKVCCRSEWSNLERKDDTITFMTETAWNPCNETWDFICEKFKSLRYFYIAEECGMSLYETNDTDGKYYRDRYKVELCTPDGEDMSEYFDNIESAVSWIAEQSGEDVKTAEEAYMLNGRWDEQDGYCVIHQFDINGN